MTVAADGYYTFNYTFPVMSSDWLYASFWEDSGTDYRFLSRVSKGFLGLWPRTDTKIHADVDEDYNVTLSLYLKSFTDDDVLNIVNITVIDGTGKIYHQETFSKTLSWKEVYEAEYVFPLTSEYKSDHFYVYAKCQYSTKYYNGTIGHGHSHFEIPQLSLWLGMEKTSYQVGERLEFDVRIANNPVVPWNQTIEVTVPDIPFMNSTYIEMPADGVQTLHYEVDIPIDATPGDKKIIVVRVEDAKTSSYRYNIPYSRLYARVGVDEASPGETVAISVTNTGGVPTNYTYELSLKDKSSTLLTQDGSDTMQPMETKTIQFTVPTDAVKGDYRIHLFLNNTGAPPQTYDRYYPLWVDGLEANLTAWTDSSVYLSNQEINVTSLIENLDGEISGGTLRLQIYSSIPYQECEIEIEMCEGPLLTLINSTDIPVDVTGTLVVNTTFQPFLRQPPLMVDPGRFYLNAELYSSSGQIIDTNGTYFYVKDYNVFLTLDTGRQIFRPNETIPVHVEVYNNESETVYGWISVSNNGTQIYYDNYYSLDSNNTLVVEVDTSSTGNFTLMCMILTTGAGPYFFDVLSVDIEIADPQLNATLNAPYMVGSDPFNATLELENPGRIPLELDVDFDGDITHHSIPPGHGELIQKQMAITENKTLTVEITGYVNTTLEAEIIFGENLSMAISPSSFYLEGTVDIPYNFTNDGLMETIFNATFTLEGEETTTYVDLPPGGNVSNVLLYNLSKGMYFFTYHTPFQEGNFTLNVEAPAEFNVTHLPEGNSFDIGELAEMNITLKNVGGILGGAQVNFTVPGITTQTSMVWLRSGEETNVSFSFPVPDDLEGGTYTSIYTVNGTVYPVDFTVQGINISFSASLDKMLYEAGENATLSLTVENLNDLELSLFSRLGLGDHFNATSFNMTSYETRVIDFDVPVVFDQGKLTYSVYADTGRALYLNAVYLHEKPDPASGISLYTDKQVYEMGENVTISVNATQTGDLNLTAPSYQNFSSITPGIYEYVFDLPSLRTGTYYVDYDFDGYNGSIPIDVIGYTAITVDVNLDKSHYTSNDTLEITLTINTNRAFDGLVKAWVFNPEDQLLGESGKNHTFTAGDNSVTLTVPLLSNSPGLHWYAFRVYAYGSLISLSTGGGYFDVGDTMPPTITIISPESKTYTSTSLPLTYHIDEPVSWAGYSLDSATNVTLTGNVTLSGLSIGSHSLVVYATDESDNTGSTSVTFTVSSPPPPPPPPPPSPPFQPLNVPPEAVTLDEPGEVTRDSMRLTWTQNPEPDFLQYEVYQSTDEESLGTLAAEIADRTVTTYYASDLAFNTTYHFTVRTVDTGLLYSDSNRVSGLIFYDDPPEITHEPVQEALEGHGIDVHAAVTDDLGPVQAFLHYKKSGDPGFTTVEMESLEGLYTATIPGTAVSTSILEYYIEASDGANTATDPSEDPQTSPHIIVIEMYPTPVSLDEPEENVTDTVKLTWTECPDQDFDVYEIHMSEEAGSMGAKIHEVTDRGTTTFNVEGLEPDSTYYFTVIVRDSMSLQMASNPVAVETQMVHDEPPVIIHFPVEEGVERTPIYVWVAISDDVGVTVVSLYYRNTPVAEFEAVEMEVCDSCIDTYKGTIPGSVVVSPVVEYFIIASDGVNTASYPEVSPEASPVSVEINLFPSSIALEEPSSEDVDAESVVLTWEESPDHDFAGYAVYVSEVKGSFGELLMNVTERSNVSAEVSELSPDTEYYFAVRVFDEGGLSPYSNQVAVRTKARGNMFPLFGGLMLLAAAVVAVIFASKKGLLGLPQGS